MMLFDKRLKSCPLCGSSEIYLEEKPFGVIVEVNVGCADCGLKGHKAFLLTVIDRHKKVIDYWNHRVPVDPFNSWR